jgi:hypothetical protein
LTSPTVAVGSLAEPDLNCQAVRASRAAKPSRSDSIVPAKCRQATLALCAAIITMRQHVRRSTPHAAIIRPPIDQANGWERLWLGPAVPHSLPYGTSCSPPERRRLTQQTHPVAGKRLGTCVFAHERQPLLVCTSLCDGPIECSKCCTIDVWGEVKPVTWIGSDVCM